jgi:single-stranded DNA-specific DHH superfamily exonuclease
MRYYDVFNGDADGICALHQLRLADPVDSILVTGLKHDIALLDRVPAGDGDAVTVLDVSLERNRGPLMALLQRGAIVRYFDHHFAGSVPLHPGLEAVIDTAGATCTSALVDRHLRGRFRAWAVVGAFGDNLDETATALAVPLGLDAERLERLRELGEDLNYNAYGESEADVLVPPIELYRIVSHYADPFELSRKEPAVARIARERKADLRRALDAKPFRSMPEADVYVLPDESWSRRVSGTFANRLALAEPHRAHAVLTPASGGGCAISVRSPRGNRPSAVEFCRRFPTGGGRERAAGIERLEAARVEEFVDAFGRAWRR